MVPTLLVFQKALRIGLFSQVLGEGGVKPLVRCVLEFVLYRAIRSHLVYLLSTVLYFYCSLCCKLLRDGLDLDLKYTILINSSMDSKNQNILKIIGHLSIG